MEAAQTSGVNQEVIDLYEQINQKIVETDFQPQQIRWILRLGADTIVSKFIAEHNVFLLEHWKDFLTLGLDKNDPCFLEVFISGLRKFVSAELRDEMVIFLAHHERRLEYELPKRIQLAVSDSRHHELGEITEDCAQRRAAIREVVQAGFGVKAEFDHRSGEVKIERPASR